jgi:hypothetical protein
VERVSGRVWTKMEKILLGYLDESIDVRNEPFKASGHFICQKVERAKSILSVRRVPVWFLHGSSNCGTFLYSIITEMESLLRGTSWIFIFSSFIFVSRGCRKLGITSWLCVSEWIQRRRIAPAGVTKYGWDQNDRHTLALHQGHSEHTSSLTCQVGAYVTPGFSCLRHFSNTLHTTTRQSIDVLLRSSSNFSIH